MRIIIIALSAFIVYGFGSTSAMYTKNISDELKVYKVEEKVDAIFAGVKSTSEKEQLKQTVKKRIQKILSKTEKEILQIHVLKERHFNSFKEYVLARIYRQLEYGRYFGSSISGRIKVVENDFARAIVSESTHSKIIVTKNAFYNETFGSYDKMVELFYVPSDKSIIDFINENILENKYIGKCHAVANPKYTGISDGVPGEETYSIVAYGDYKRSLETPEAQMSGKWMGACGVYGQTNGVRYFEMLSPNILMFAQPGQGGIPIDLGSIEVKNKVYFGGQKRIQDFGEGLTLEVEGSKSYLYYKKKLVHVAWAMEGISSVHKAELGSNGIYVLIRGHNGFSQLLMFDRGGGNKRVLKNGSPDAGEGQTIIDFELLHNKQIKIFLGNGMSPQIINID